MSPIFLGTSKLAVNKKSLITIFMFKAISGHSKVSPLLSPSFGHKFYRTVQKYAYLLLHLLVLESSPWLEYR